MFRLLSLTVDIIGTALNRIRKISELEIHEKSQTVIFMNQGQYKKGSIDIKNHCIIQMEKTKPTKFGRLSTSRCRCNTGER